MKRLALFSALMFVALPGRAQSQGVPPDARKAFDQGMESLANHKAADAEKDFEKAVKLYPQYADAWLNLGKARLQRKATDSAAQAFQKAVAADDRLGEAQFNLGMLEVAKKQWPEAAKHLDAAVQLEPVKFPDAWYNDAVADYNLREFNGAEKSAREFMKLDPHHKNGQADFLLGAILAGKDDYSGAAEELRIYIKSTPKGPDVARAKTLLDEIEKIQTPNRH